jgi:hypothetical protein
VLTTPRPRLVRSRWSIPSMKLTVSGFHIVDDSSLTPEMEAHSPAFERHEVEKIMDAWREVPGRECGYYSHIDAFWFSAPGLGILEFRGLDLAPYHCYPIQLIDRPWHEDPL